MPHIGSATKETRDAMGFRALDNLDAFLRAANHVTAWLKTLNIEHLTLSIDH